MWDLDSSLGFGIPFEAWAKHSLRPDMPKQAQSAHSSRLTLTLTLTQTLTLSLTLALTLSLTLTLIQAGAVCAELPPRERRRLPEGLRERPLPHAPRRRRLRDAAAAAAVHRRREWRDALVA